MGRRRSPATENPPQKHIILAGGAQHIWIKLRWEANQIRKASEATPFDLISFLYGAMNFAITSQSLEDWVCTALARRDRQSRKATSDYPNEIAKAIPMQPAFRDIANTAKHGEYREANWIGGTVELIHTVGFTGTPKEYALIYHSPEGPTHSSVDVFENTTQHWLKYLIGAQLVKL